MTAPTVTVARKGPGAPEVRRRIERLQNIDVLVGIPMASTKRRVGFINNASLLYVLTHGSPARHIPAAPVIEPAIVAPGNKEAIANELKGAAKAYMENNADETLLRLRRAGMAGMNASKAWFTDPRNGWPPNAPSTIRRKGSDRRNIKTGALRRAITYVVRYVR
jgi:hypothetical protein